MVSHSCPENCYRGHMTTRPWGNVKLRASGNYTASYVHDGIRHRSPITFTSQANAHGWLNDEKHLIERGDRTYAAQR